MVVHSSSYKGAKNAVGIIGAQSAPTESPPSGHAKTAFFVCSSYAERVESAKGPDGPTCTGCGQGKHRRRVAVLGARCRLRVWLQSEQSTAKQQQHSGSCLTN